MAIVCRYQSYHDDDLLITGLVLWLMGGSWVAHGVVDCRACLDVDRCGWSRDEESGS